MIDYIKTLNYITDKLTTPTHTISLIATIIFILMLAVPTILAFFFDSNILSLYTC